jgi:hypothetical protein
VIEKTLTDAGGGGHVGNMVCCLCDLLAWFIGSYRYSAPHFSHLTLNMSAKSAAWRWRRGWPGATSAVPLCFALGGAAHVRCCCAVPSTDRSALPYPPTSTVPVRTLICPYLHHHHHCRLPRCNTHTGPAPRCSCLNLSPMQPLTATPVSIATPCVHTHLVLRQ